MALRRNTFVVVLKNRMNTSMDKSTPAPVTLHLASSTKNVSVTRTNAMGTLRIGTRQLQPQPQQQLQRQCQQLLPVGLQQKKLWAHF